MRPGILDVGGKRHRAALLQRGVGNVDVEQRQLRSDAGVEDGLGCHWLTPRTLGGCDRAGEERGKCAAIDHGGFPPMSFCLFLPTIVARTAAGRNRGLRGQVRA